MRLLVNCKEKLQKKTQLIFLRSKIHIFVRIKFIIMDAKLTLKLNQEVIERANNSQYGLAAAIHTK